LISLPSCSLRYTCSQKFDKAGVLFFASSPFFSPLFPPRRGSYCSSASTPSGAATGAYDSIHPFSPPPFFSSLSRIGWMETSFAFSSFPTVTERGDTVSEGSDLPLRRLALPLSFSLSKECQCLSLSPRCKSTKRSAALDSPSRFFFLSDRPGPSSFLFPSLFSEPRARALFLVFPYGVEVIPVQMSTSFLLSFLFFPPNKTPTKPARLFPNGRRLSPPLLFTLWTNGFTASMRKGGSIFS